MILARMRRRDLSDTRHTVFNVLACIALLVASRTSVAAQTAPLASTPPQPIVAATPTAVNAEVEALKAQTAEMRRSEDRLLSTVLWALAVVSGAALVNWFIGRTFYKRDLANMKAEVLDDLRNDVRDKELPKIEAAIRASLDSRAAATESHLNALVLDRVSQLYADVGQKNLTAEAARVSLEQLGASLSSGAASNLAIPALRRLRALLDHDTIGNLIPDNVVTSISDELTRSPQLAGNPDARELHTAVARWRSRRKVT